MKQTLRFHCFLLFSALPPFVCQAGENNNPAALETCVGQYGFANARFYEELGGGGISKGPSLLLYHLVHRRIDAEILHGIVQSFKPELHVDIKHYFSMEANKQQQNVQVNDAPVFYMDLEKSIKRVLKNEHVLLDEADGRNLKSANKGGETIRSSSSDSQQCTEDADVTNSNCGKDKDRNTAHPVEALDDVHTFSEIDILSKDLGNEQAINLLKNNQLARLHRLQHASGWIRAQFRFSLNWFFIKECLGAFDWVLMGDSDTVVDIAQFEHTYLHRIGILSGEHQAWETAAQKSVKNNHETKKASHWKHKNDLMIVAGQWACQPLCGGVGVFFNRAFLENVDRVVPFHEGGLWQHWERDNFSMEQHYDSNGHTQFADDQILGAQILAKSCPRGSAEE
eukprot:TRINITY_DN44616_c0_g1_i1.p1 TRINITY_DN44616_c0_g1~~TRINITY_DN44616_c0_g1_i1.p1  ORF type:complete len:396 (-),score=52.51 TRINITY_DN44616_c0_g1_i1:271-1458(-)